METTTEHHRRYPKLGTFCVLLLVIIKCWDIKETKAQSETPWNAINSNRFCCERALPNPMPQPPTPWPQPPSVADSTPDKYTRDIDTPIAGDAGLRTTYTQNVFHSYRIPQCQKLTLCASFPPSTIYTGDCIGNDAAWKTITVPLPDTQEEKCRLYNELRTNVPEILPRRRLKNLNAETDCVFRVHYALTDELVQGFKVFTTFFTEKTQVNVKEDLAEPKTSNFFTETKIGDATNIFGFPYFLVIRAECENGGFYGDEVYNFPINGNSLSTSIAINYKAYTSRQEYQSSLRILLEAVFVNLSQGGEEDDNDLVPNPYTPRMRDPDKGVELCHMHVCFPAFLIPLPLLKVPIFEIQIREHRAIAKIQKLIYGNPYHKREAGGLPPLEIAEVFPRYNLANEPKERKFVETTFVSPRDFFPVNRYGDYDTDLELYQEIPQYAVCIVPEQYRLQGEDSIPPTFQMFHKEEKRMQAMLEMDEIRSHLPLTQDDFMQPQFTYGTAPTVVIAGFFRPDLVLFGNPDMSEIELIKWAYNQEYDTSAAGQPERKRIFFTREADTGPVKTDAIPDCLSEKPVLRNPFEKPPPILPPPVTPLPPGDFRPRPVPDAFRLAPIYRKPIYSHNNDGLDTCYGRRQYFPMDYTLPDTHAIFDVIALEDRLLLKTAGGLVSLYGNDAVTISKDIVFNAKSNETLRRCFKFVRVGRKALMEFDPILAVTYTYTEQSTQTFRDQEVWFGKMIKAGEPIIWTEIGATEYDDSKLSSPLHVSPAISNTATTTDIPEALKICQFVFQKRVLPIFEAGALQNIVEFQHRNRNEFKCKILDGSPVPTRPNSIQLLVEMSFKFYKLPACRDTTTPPPPECTPFKVQSCARYLYCANLLKKLERTARPTPDPRVTAFLNLVGRPRCEKNFQSMLDGLYDGTTKDLDKIAISPKTKYIDANMSDTLDCETNYQTLTTGTPPMPTLRPEGDFCNFNIQTITLYIIAEHATGEGLQADPWEIIGIYPQRPCRMPHFEAIRTPIGFDKSYFGGGVSLTGFATPLGSIPGAPVESCFEAGKNTYEADLILERMTYTRQINLHLFLYGNALLHSVDGGKSMSHLRGFPKREFNGDFDYDMLQINNRHVIKLMAFNDHGQYAFLTSKRELWLGNTGSLTQYRLRPSNGYSMMYLSLYKDRPTIAQGVPFALMYDSYNELFELVVIRDSENHAQEIVKRPIDTQLILRNEYMVNQLHTYVNEVMLTNIYIVRPDAAMVPIVPAPTPTPVTYVEDGLTFTVNIGSPGISCEQSLGCLTVKYPIEKLTLHCPYSQMQAQQNYSKTMNRLQQFNFLAPIQHQKLGLDFKQGSLLAYQAATFSLVYNSFLKREKEKRVDDFYSRVARDTFDKWKDEKLSETYIGLLHYLRGDSQKSGILVDPRLYTRDLDPSDSTRTRFLSNYWLNYNQTVELILQFYIKNAQLLSKTDFTTQLLSEIQLNIDNGNGRLVQLESERVILSKYASVQFVVWIKLIKNATLLKQNEPGQGLIPVPLTFHLIDAFGRCFDSSHWGMVGESIATTVFAGCPPAAGILFNWNSTLNSLIFKDDKVKYGDATYCHKREFVCFFAREAITFHFDVLDMAKQRYVPFRGIYKFKVIGGGRTKADIKDYNPEEIEAYNIQGRSDVSLIWTLALVQEDETGKIPVFPDIGKDPNTQETLLMAGISRIKWVCNTLSPCARIAPRGILFKTIYYFKVEITNEGVDPGTLCKHKLTFVIMLYGFPPSPEMLLLTTLVFCFLLLLFMYIMFVCCRRNRKVWRANKLKLSGWFKIIIDTFPKSMKKKANAVDDQTRKDAILLSLQGHLKVPNVVLRKREGSPPSDEDLSVKSSDSSITSQSYSEVLPEVKSRKAAATWTDMVYEQIISRRLLAIVDRNKRMREQIMKKTLNLHNDLPSIEDDENSESLTQANAEKEKLEKKTEPPAASAPKPKPKPEPKKDDPPKKK